jgi:hypothetical protein
MAMTRCALLWLGLIVASVVSLTSAGGVAGQEEDPPAIKAILRDWKKRQDRVKTVRYRVEGTLTFSKEAVAIENSSPRRKAKWPKLELRAVALQQRFFLLLDFTTNRHRVEHDSERWLISTGEILRKVKKEVFNGEVSKFFGYTVSKEGKKENTNPDTPDLTILSGCQVQARIDKNYAPVLAGHGIIAISDNEEFLPGKLKTMPDMSVLTVHGRGVYEGRSCVILRTHPYKGTRTHFREFWIDPARDSALVRIIDYSDKFPVRERTIVYEPTPGGWLTSSWSDIRRLKGPGGKVETYSERRYRVVERSVNVLVTDADLDLPLLSAQSWVFGVFRLVGQR